AEKIAENTDALEETDTKVHTDVRLRNVPTSRLKKRTKYMTTVQGHIGIGISLAFMVPLLLTLNDIFFWLAFGSAAVTAIFLFVQWARKNSVKGTIRK
ncbi:MAG: hypothetical protein FWE44_07720, partial [Defluviitaleaceae bacterium]|nr:hypothetical protein [Defluviitaleaceae bacterium]